MADSRTDTTPHPDEAQHKGVASVILLDMADTSWRLFVPTIGLLMIGRYFDARYGFKPWLMLVGVALGSLIAAYLIKHQLERGVSN